MKTLRYLLLLCSWVVSVATAVDANVNHGRNTAFFERHPPANLFDSDGNNNTDADPDGYGVTRPFQTTRVAVHIPAGFRRHSESQDQNDTDTNTTTTLNEPHVSAPWPRTSWAGSLSEFVYYFDGDLCHWIGWTNETEHGFPFYPKQSEAAADAPLLNTPFILLAPASPACAASLQARRAADLGAAALLLADEHCPCLDEECIAKYHGDSNDNNNCRPADDKPVLHHDGGADVFIPVALLNKMTAEGLKEILVQDNQPVLLEYTWGLQPTIPNATTAEEYAKDELEYHIWTDVAHDVSAMAVAEFQTVQAAFPTTLQLVPKLAVRDGARFQCTNNAACQDLCTNGGRYCAISNNDVLGTHIVEETLRRLCILEHAPKHYMDYWHGFLSTCASSAANYSSPDCLQTVYANAQIETVEDINSCISDSGGTDDPAVENALLQAQLKEQQAIGLAQYPAILNGKTHNALHDLSYDHNVPSADAGNLFRHSCIHMYWRAKTHVLPWHLVPDVCYVCVECHNAIECLENGGKCTTAQEEKKKNQEEEKEEEEEKKKEEDDQSKSKSKKKRHPVRNFFLWIFFLGIIGYAARYGYERYYLNSVLTDSRNNGGLLGNYMQLNSGDTI